VQEIIQTEIWRYVDGVSVDVTGVLQLLQCFIELLLYCRAMMLVKLTRMMLYCRRGVTYCTAGHNGVEVTYRWGTPYLWQCNPHWLSWYTHCGACDPGIESHHQSHREHLCVHSECYMQPWMTRSADPSVVPRSTQPPTLQGTFKMNVSSRAE